jgi:broad specificity phosphatase PhoE
MTSTLILVRHGQTDWNVEGRYQGQTNNPLNKVGQQQAREAAAALRGIPIKRIYSSDLLRALQTAHIMADLLRVPFTRDARLREIHQGKWQGMLYADIERDYKRELRQFRKQPLKHSPPEGETLADVAQRFFEAMDEIAEAHPHEHVILVTHKLPIALARCRIGNLPLSQVWEMLPLNVEHQQIVWPIWVGQGE